MLLPRETCRNVDGCCHWCEKGTDVLGLFVCWNCKVGDFAHISCDLKVFCTRKVNAKDEGKWQGEWKEERERCLGTVSSWVALVLVDWYSNIWSLTCHWMEDMWGERFMGRQNVEWLYFLWFYCLCFWQKQYGGRDASSLCRLWSSLCACFHFVLKSTTK